MGVVESCRMFDFGRRNYVLLTNESRMYDVTLQPPFLHPLLFETNFCTLFFPFFYTCRCEKRLTSGHHLLAKSEI